MYSFELQENDFLRNIRARREMAAEKYLEASIPFERADLKVLIFPYPETRKMAFEDSGIRQKTGP